MQIYINTLVVKRKAERWRGDFPILYGALTDTNHPFNADALSSVHSSHINYTVLCKSGLP